jgi:hypothetical protein
MKLKLYVLLLVNTGTVGNNRIGVVGVNWNVKFAALNFLDSKGSSLISNAKYSFLNAIYINYNRINC